MKNRKLTLIMSAIAAIGAVGLSACTDSRDEVQDVPADGAIRFAANTEYSRAGDITTANLAAFNVYAYTGTGTTPNLFMDNVEVTKTANNVWTYSPVEYWPSKETVDFYAFAPASWVGTTGPLKPVSYDSYPGTEDIIYAVSPNLSGNTGAANAQVLFNFRHALSKVTVKMSSTNSGLEVRVTNVGMANLMTKGNFHFPSGSTGDAMAAENVGTWTDQNTPAPYVLHMSRDTTEMLILDTTPMEIGDLGIGGKYMMPQTLTWRSNGAGNDTYLAVMCSIYDSQSGAKLWPNANTPDENIAEGSTFGDGLLKFPLSTSRFSKWEPGCHYIYNLVINSNDEMGTIEFGTPTVDTFVDVTTTYQ